MRAPPLADTVGNVATAATILHADDRAVDIGLHRGSDAGVARGQKLCVARPGMTARRGGRGQLELAATAVGGAPASPLAASP